MAYDVCSDCERIFPGGEGLVDGVCPECREARALHKPADETAPEPATEERQEEQ